MRQQNENRKIFNKNIRANCYNTRCIYMPCNIECLAHTVESPAIAVLHLQQCPTPELVQFSVKSCELTVCVVLDTVHSGKHSLQYIHYQIKFTHLLQYSNKLLCYQLLEPVYVTRNCSLMTIVLLVCQFTCVLISAILSTKCCLTIDISSITSQTYNKYVHVCASTYMYAHACACMCKYIHVCACMYKYVHVCVHVLYKQNKL